MPYRTDATGTKALAGSTSIGLLTQSLIAQIQSIYSAGYYRATLIGGVATFYNVNGIANPTTLTIPIGTMDSVVIGERVFVDAGGGGYQVGAVIADPSTISIGATTSALSKSARAIDVSQLTGYSIPSAIDTTAETSSLVGVAVDGHAWFSNARLGNFYGLALSTVSGISAGDYALCETVASTGTTSFSTIVQTGTGTGTVIPSAIPGFMPSKHSISIRIDVSGVAGTVASWSFAIDGGGYVSAGVVAAFQITPGITIALSGVFTATDVYAFTIIPPTGGTWRLLQL